MSNLTQHQIDIEFERFYEEAERRAKDNKFDGAWRAAMSRFKDFLKTGVSDFHTDFLPPKTYAKGKSRTQILKQIESRIQILEKTGGPFRIPSEANDARIRELRDLLGYATGGRKQ